VTAHDLSSQADGLARPGMDPRGWVHYAIVCPETAGQKSVAFTDAQGNPNVFGVQVLVKLLPNANILPCRVAGSVAAAGAAEYHPFIGGDEVIVVVPGGDERNGGVIIGRLTQSFDTFPTTVAGQDATKNNISFKRMVEPYALESGTAVLIRVSATGAALTLDPTGNTYLSSGSGASLYMRSDVASFELKGTAAGFQLDPSDDSAQVIAGGGNTTFKFDGSADQYQSSGSLSFSTLGNAGGNHATTIEAVVNLLNTFFLAASAAATAPPALLAFFASLSAPTTLIAAIEAAAALPLDPLLGEAISGGLEIPKTGGSPGIGSPGFMID
jgi:hypothetical protein